nr:MAG TPA: hypothetical protein [Caudoviricetes sp.]
MSNWLLITIQVRFLFTVHGICYIYYFLFYINTFNKLILFVKMMLAPYLNRYVYSLTNRFVRIC